MYSLVALPLRISGSMRQSVLTVYRSASGRSRLNTMRRIASAEDAQRLIAQLSADERQLLKRQLEAASPAASATVSAHPDSAAGRVARPTNAQLCRIALFCGLPFMGFGILDNTIMLTAGGYIEVYFGTMLGISTLAAAALGNMVSDIAGITTAGMVEAGIGRIGLAAPALSAAQMSMRSTKFAGNVGRCVFVVIGCFIGMFPLLLLPSTDES